MPLPPILLDVAGLTALVTAVSTIVTLFINRRQAVSTARKTDVDALEVLIKDVATSQIVGLRDEVDRIRARIKEAEDGRAECEKRETVLSARLEDAEGERRALSSRITKLEGRVKTLITRLEEANLPTNGIDG